MTAEMIETRPARPDRNFLAVAPILRGPADELGPAPSGILSRFGKFDDFPKREGCVAA
jgi:hypothetical protein